MLLHASVVFYIRIMRVQPSLINQWLLPGVFRDSDRKRTVFCPCPSSPGNGVDYDVSVANIACTNLQLGELVTRASEPERKPLLRTGAEHYSNHTGQKPGSSAVQTTPVRNRGWALNPGRSIGSRVR